MDQTVPSGPKDPWATPPTLAGQATTTNRLFRRRTPIPMVDYFRACLDRMSFGLAEFGGEPADRGEGRMQDRIAEARMGGFTTKTAVWAKGS